MPSAATNEQASNQLDLSQHFPHHTITTYAIKDIVLSNDHSDIASSLTFLKDEAAGVDFFGSHAQLGEAIAEALLTNPTMNVIGLLGPWGSGKSTVVSQLQSALENRQKDIKTHTFVYDTWLHQSEPARRSFLEGFLTDLDARHLLKKADFKDELDRVLGLIEDKTTTTTPVLTVSGKLLLFSVFLFPVGLRLAGSDYFSKLIRGIGGPSIDWDLLFTTLFLLAPFIAAFAVYLFWRPSLRFWTRPFWTKHREPYAKESIFSLFINKSVAKQTNTVVKNPEPSSIEFQRFFSKLVNALDPAKYRVLVVIDNLDRLPAKEAVAMWTTIRSFFLGNQDPFKQPGTATILLPVDETSIAKMFSGEENKTDEQVASFMEKTFDLTFKVTPPVMSDWKGYLKKQMEAVFGDGIDSERIYVAGVLLEMVTGFGAPITPRKINVTVNSIGTLWLQRRNDDISFAAIAFYTIYRAAIADKGLLFYLSSPPMDISRFDPEWRRALPAIHYGVNVEKALQVLLNEQLQNVVQQSSADDFRTLALTPGFEEAFRNFLASFGGAPSAPLPLKLAILLASIGEQKSHWVLHAWTDLRALFLKAPDFVFVDQAAILGFKHLLTSGDRNGMAQFVADVHAKVVSLASVFVDREENIPAFLEVVTALVRASQEHSIPMKAIKIPDLQPASYVGILAAVASQPLIKDVFEYAGDPSQLAQTITQDFASSSEVMVEPRIKALFEAHPTLNYTPITAGAEDLVRQRNGSDWAVSPALWTLGYFASNAAVDRSLQSLINDGHLQARLQERAPSASRLVARVVALTLAKGPPYSLGTDWRTVGDIQSEIVPEILSALTDFKATISWNALIQAIDHAPDFFIVSQPLITAILMRQEGITVTDFEFLMSRIDSVVSTTQVEFQLVAMAQIAELPGFWAVFENRNTDDQVDLIFGVLHASEDTEITDPLYGAMQRKFDRKSDAEWQNEIRSGGQMLNRAQRFVQASGMTIVGGGNALLNALDQLRQELHQIGDPGFQLRWFQAANLLPENIRKLRFENLRDSMIGLTPASFLPIVNAGGDPFLIDADFLKRADDFVRHIIAPLLNSADDAMQLLSRPNIYREWLEKSRANTRDAIREQLESLMAAAGAGNGERLSEVNAKLNIGAKLPR
jgi:energy-coupling factor transporter ATP-binding protein EcfA2